MMSKWQPKTRGGYPVEITGRIDNGVYALEGVVTDSVGWKTTMTWTKDGHHIDGQASHHDLIPLEAAVEAPVEPDARKALAEAARAYKRACDATEAAEEAEQLAHDALSAAFETYGVPTVAVNVDGAVYLFEHDGGVGYAEIEVL